MNLLTFDIEDWYHINYPVVDFSFWEAGEDHAALLDRTGKIIRHCREHRLQATFFVLGRLLEKKPRLGEMIVEQGQELALHGYEHDLLNQKNQDHFKIELDRAVTAYRKITGLFPKGFRAPSWSLNAGNLWVLEVLEAFGFAYDASLFPIRTFLYGLPSAPLEPFYPVIGGKKLRLLEVPVSVFPLGTRRLPYSGGLYFNLWPFPIIRSLARRLTDRGKINLFYFHPWDLWKRSPKQVKALKAPWLRVHLGNTLKKFEKLLASIPMGSIEANLGSLQAQASPARIGDEDGT